GPGGAIYNKPHSTLVINYCTFINNSASDGGAILDQGVLAVSNSTFVGNLSGSPIFGGSAIYAVDVPDGEAATVTNTTFFGNSAKSGGGTIEAGVGAGSNLGALTINNSIIAGSTSSANCAGPIANAGFNISDDSSCAFGNSTGASGQTLGDGIN